MAPRIGPRPDGTTWRAWPERSLRNGVWRIRSEPMSVGFGFMRIRRHTLRRTLVMLNRQLAPCLLAALVPLFAYANPANLDTRFGDGGSRTYDFVTTNFDRFVVVSAFGTLPEGYLAVVERPTPPDKMHQYLLRFDERGNELSSIDLGLKASEFYGAEFTPDGKLVTVSFASVGGEFGLTIQRRTSGGTLDPTYGGGDGRVEIFDPGNRLVPRAISLDAQGRLTMAGFRQPPVNATDATTSLFVARIDALGVPIASFGGDGIAVVDFLPGMIETPEAVAGSADGSVLVCDDGNYGGQIDTTLTKFGAGGQIDTDYGSGGTLYYDSSLPGGPNRADYCSALALHPISGTAHVAVRIVGSQYQVRLLRVNAQGDATALSDLMNSTDSPYYAVALTFDARARALLMASVDNNTAEVALEVARYDASGLRDSTFGTSGVKHHLIPLPPSADPATLRSLVTHLKSDARGRILLAAELDQTSSTLAGWTAIRLNGDLVFADGLED
jgi:hypothetical protein